MLNLTAILSLAQTAPSYVPPISLYDLGARQYQRGMEISELWPPSMRQGWQDAKAAQDMPADFAGALEDVANGARYLQSVDWEAVENEKWGD